MTTMWRLGLCGQIKRLAYLAAAFVPMLLTMAGPIAAEPTYKVTNVINLPGGQQITSIDIQTVSPALGLYAMTDRKNKAVNVFNTANDTFLFQTTGFCGLAGATPACGGTFASEAGPNGIIFVNNKEIWAPDADSTIKVIDLATRTITKTISVGGTKRADELCHDPNTNTVLVANDRAVDNFIAFINAATYTVTKKIKLDGTGGTPNATNGIEQCQYDPRTGLFYIPAWEETSSVFTKREQEYKPGVNFAGGGFTADVGLTATNTYTRTEDEGYYGSIKAVDPKTGDMKWVYKMSQVTDSGVLTTALCYGLRLYVGPRETSTHLIRGYLDEN